MRCRSRPVRGGLPQGALFLTYPVLFCSGRFIFFFRDDVPTVALGLKTRIEPLPILLIAVPILLVWMGPPAERLA
jgi:hypothetical protein